jgi:hypothetical protein
MIETTGGNAPNYLMPFFSRWSNASSTASAPSEDEEEDDETEPELEIMVFMPLLGLEGGPSAPSVAVERLTVQTWDWLAQESPANVSVRVLGMVGEPAACDPLLTTWPPRTRACPCRPRAHTRPTRSRPLIASSEWR